MIEADLANKLTTTSADLYFASKFVQKPEQPMRRTQASLISSGKHVPDPAAVEMSTNLGTGFKYLCSSLPGRAVYEILQNVGQLTVALDQHTRRGKGAPDMVDLVLARNVAQHQLLSLDPISMDGEMEDRTIAELCRIATLIYSDMVIFPLPATQRVKPALAVRMRTLLDDFKDGRGQERHRRVICWATTLGCVASTFTSMHQWFLEELRLHAFGIKIQDWPGLKGLCSKFLWWPPVCDLPGRVVWSEIQALTESQSGYMVYR
jgi:hypothetical protein